jgi:hypothetical protein
MRGDRELSAAGSGRLARRRSLRDAGPLASTARIYVRRSLARNGAETGIVDLTYARET